MAIAHPENPAPPAIMAYEQKSNTGTLFTNERKAAENHPDYTGKLLIGRDLLQKLAVYGEANLEISAWVKTTKAGKTIISLQCKEPYQRQESPPQQYAPEMVYEPTAHQSPTPTKPPADPQAYLNKLKVKIAACTNLQEFEELYKKINSPEVWAVFKSVPAIAQEASDLLSAKKAQLVFSAEPIDLSAILSELDVHCQRLNLGKAEHCMVRWNKPRERLSTEELQIYLLELRSAQPMPPDNGYF